MESARKGGIPLAEIAVLVGPGMHPGGRIGPALDYCDERLQPERQAGESLHHPQGPRVRGEHRYALRAGEERLGALGQLARRRKPRRERNLAFDPPCSSAEKTWATTVSRPVTSGSQRRSGPHGSPSETGTR